MTAQTDPVSGEDVPTRKEAVDGLFAVQYLIEACADGSFYQDYDESTRLLGKARQGMSVVARFLDDDGHIGRTRQGES